MPTRVCSGTSKFWNLVIGDLLRQIEHTTNSECRRSPDSRRALEEREAVAMAILESWATSNKLSQKGRQWVCCWMRGFTTIDHRLCLLEAAIWDSTIRYSTVMFQWVSELTATWRRQEIRWGDFCALVQLGGQGSGLWLGTRTGAGGTATLTESFFGRSPWLHGQQEDRDGDTKQ